MADGTFLTAGLGSRQLLRIGQGETATVTAALSQSLAGRTLIFEPLPLEEQINEEDL